MAFLAREGIILPTEQITDKIMFWGFKVEIASIWSRIESSSLMSLTREGTKSNIRYRKKVI